MATNLDSETVGRVVLVGGLLLILLVGLVWAFNPTEEGGITFSTDGTQAAEGELPEPPPAPPEEDARPPADEADPADPSPTPEPTEAGPDVQALIEAAPDPADTTVQVLDAGGGSAAAQDAADALRELGYQVVNVTSARAAPPATTIWFTDGAQDAAEALRARDDRISDIEQNQVLSTAVDLHVLVAGDWPG